ncbi:amino acid ABC transporter substrate-binding protein [Pelagibius sp. Alg239-R121]|uniref:amino acid ABC transporter substrate-binding protein n=1 Tax=Pelagibius sp. Alg239-R121 TaxID=2993448 RepID=UPI0024A6C627|nr:amino acid ABC transporter substrate-binding protein [Pelagibius sp. Alg239-R121]
MKRSFGTVPVIGMIAGILALGGIAGEAAAGALERIKESGKIKIAYREDAAPYSVKNAIGEPAGYSVDLCRAVVVHLKAHLKLTEISIDYVAVDSANRFEAVQSEQADLLCGAATATLARRELVDFSIPIFVDGAAVMTKLEGPKNFEALKGLKIGVLKATTTEQLLRNIVEKTGLDSEIVTVTNHLDGRGKLESGEISAYFSDRALLVYLAAQSTEPKSFRIGKRFFSHEPYALAMKRGDSDFRLAVDRALSRIYRSDNISSIFNNAFGGGKPSDILRAMYLVSALPE